MPAKEITQKCKHLKGKRSLTGSPGGGGGMGWTAPSRPTGAAIAAVGSAFGRAGIGLGDLAFDALA